MLNPNNHVNTVKGFAILRKERLNVIRKERLKRTTAVHVLGSLFHRLKKRCQNLGGPPLTKLFWSAHATYQVPMSPALWFWRIFNGFLRYTGVAANFVMWPGQFELIFVSPFQGVTIINLSSTGPVVSERTFEKFDGRTLDAESTTDGRMNEGRRSDLHTIAHLWTFGSGELTEGYLHLCPRMDFL